MRAGSCKIEMPKFQVVAGMTTCRQTKSLVQNYRKENHVYQPRALPKDQGRKGS